MGKDLFVFGSTSFVTDEHLQQRLPRVSIALEYVANDCTLNFYIKKVSDSPLVVISSAIRSRARIFVVKGIGRKTWMGRSRIVTEEELESSKPLVWRTLSVSRCFTTIFNEFFSCVLHREMFHKTMLRIQLCDVDVEDEEREVVIAECDYWIDTSPIIQFVEFEIPMALPNPDLGELQFGLTYLITAQRVIVSNFIGTNLRITEQAKEMYIKGALYIGEELVESHKSERREADVEQDWNKKLIFDVTRQQIYEAILILSVWMVDANHKHTKIGEVSLSYCNSSTDHSHWTNMLRNCREKAEAVHKLTPAV